MHTAREGRRGIDATRGRRALVRRALPVSIAEVEEGAAAQRALRGERVDVSLHGGFLLHHGSRVAPRGGLIATGQPADERRDLARAREE